MDMENRNKNKRLAICHSYFRQVHKCHLYTYRLYFSIRRTPVLVHFIHEAIIFKKKFQWLRLRPLNGSWPSRKSFSIKYILFVFICNDIASDLRLNV